MLLLVAGDENVVLILSLLPGPVLEGGDAVAVLSVVEPLSLVLEPVRALANAEPAALVVLPLSHVRLGHVGVQHFVLGKQKFKYWKNLNISSRGSGRVMTWKKLVTFSIYFARMTHLIVTGLMTVGRFKIKLMKVKLDKIYNEYHI